MTAALPVTPVVMVGRDKMRNVEEQEPITACSKKTRKPGYVWCPIQGYLSGPVQKLTQHLRQVHKLVPHKIARLSNPENRRYATPKAVTPRPTRVCTTVRTIVQYRKQGLQWSLT